MYFIETRGNDGLRSNEVSFKEAILNPSGSFGGLYVPKTLPTLPSLDELIFLEYKELAFMVLKLFRLDILDDTILEALNLYDKFDDSKNPAPLKKIDDNLYVCELYHGPTRAFKDMALQPFGYILSEVAKKEGREFLIIAATSGDTGPATLETFGNRAFVRAICLYPDGGTSDVQRLQMVCEDAKNLKVLGVHGNFDDTQNALKELLKDSEFKDILKSKGIELSAANSVNFGRIIFQIIYHIFAYFELVRSKDIALKEEVNLVIPSGNFGNALGAFYAKKMGVPIDKIVIASNENSILSEFINSGIYDLRDRELKKTNSPAMDILISSNVERVLFELFGADRCKELMESLSQDGHYKLDSSELVKLQNEFCAVYSDDEYGLETIDRYFLKGYLLDPHTATCIKGYEKYKSEDKKCIIYSTAEWTKFAPTIYKALFKNSIKSDKEALNHISQRGEVDIPSSIESLFEKEIVHKSVVKKDEIKKAILSWL